MKPSSTPSSGPSLPPSPWVQIRGLLIRETRRFFKVSSQTIGTPIVSMSLYIFIFGITLGSSIDLPAYTSYLEFLLPGLITLSILKNAFDNSSTSLVSAKYTNELQDLRATPLFTEQIVFSLAFVGCLRGSLIGGVTYLIGFSFAYIFEGHIIAIQHPFILLLFTLFGGTIFAFLGMSVGMSAKSFEFINSISSFVLVPLLYLGGIFFPLSKLPSFWRTLSYGNPIFYIINGIRYGLIGKCDISLLPAIGVALFFCLLFYFITRHIVDKPENYFR